MPYVWLIEKCVLYCIVHMMFASVKHWLKISGLNELSERVVCISLGKVDSEL